MTVPGPVETPTAVVSRGLRRLTRINTTAVAAAIVAVITSVTIILAAVHAMLSQLGDVRQQLRDDHLATTTAVDQIKDTQVANHQDVQASVNAIAAQVSKAPVVVTNKSTTTIIKETVAPAAKASSSRPASTSTAARPSPTPTPTPAPGLLGFLTPRG